MIPTPSQGPTVLYGRGVNSLWHDCVNGDLIVDIRGAHAHFRRDQETGQFLFDHDSLLDGAKAGLVQDVRVNENGNFVRFRTGPVRWRVLAWSPARDVYQCTAEGA